jgi:predicted N-acetyltransferase YhbS
MLVAETGDRIVGTVSIGGKIHKIPGSLRMFALDVGPNHRNRGIGTPLIRTVEDEARARGLGGWSSTTRPSMAVGSIWPRSS